MEIGKISACKWVEDCPLIEECSECRADKTGPLTREEAKVWWLGKGVDEDLRSLGTACDWVNGCQIDILCLECTASFTDRLSLEEAKIWWENRINKYKEMNNGNNS